MATVIDALVVTLGLDASAFQKGSKDATGAFAKTREAAQKMGADVEASGRTAAEGLENVARKALALFAIFAGASSVKGFIQDMVSADSALGRFAASMNVAPQTLSAFANAVERGGGNADAAAGSFRSLSDSFTELQKTGNTGILPMLQRLQGQGGAAIDMFHGTDKALVGIADNMKALADRGDVAGAHWFGRQLGLDEGSVNLAIQGSQKLQAEMEKSRRLGVVTPESAAAAQKLLEMWRSLQQAAQDLGRTVLTHLAPPVLDILGKMSKWIELNKDWLAGEITKKIEDFTSYLKSVDWAGVGLGFQQIGDAIKFIAEGLERVKRTGLIYGSFLGYTKAPDDANKGGFWGSVGRGLRRVTGMESARTNDVASHGRSVSRGQLASNQKTAYAAFKELGYSDVDAKAAVANLSGESLANPADVHADPSRSNPNQKAHGIASWDDARSARIKQQFGRMPHEMSVPDQVRAYDWEMKNYYPDAYKDARSGNPGRAIDGAVRKFEKSGSPDRDVARRSSIYNGLSITPSTTGDTKALGGAGVGKQSSLFGNGFQMADISALSSPNALQSGAVSTDNSTRSSEINVGSIVVHSQATDAHQIAKDIKPAVERHAFSQNANFSLA